MSKKRSCGYQFKIILLEIIIVVFILFLLSVLYFYLPDRIKQNEVLRACVHYFQGMAELCANLVFILGIVSISIQLRTIQIEQERQKEELLAKNQNRTNQLIQEFTKGPYKTFSELENPPLFWKKEKSLREKTDTSMLVTPCSEFMNEHAAFISSFSSIAMELEAFSQMYYLQPSESQQIITKTIYITYISVFELISPVIFKDKTESFCRTAFSFYLDCIHYQTSKEREIEDLAFSKLEETANKNAFINK